MAHSWRGDRFIAPHSEDHAAVAHWGPATACSRSCRSCSGKRLPVEARGPSGRRAARAGAVPDRLRPHHRGDVSSPRHEADGYWRGPVWAPPVLLIADGLRRLGETAAARAIADRVLPCRRRERQRRRTSTPCTGAGLRDRAYTWTASVFLVLAREYLRQCRLQENSEEKTHARPTLSSASRVAPGRRAPASIRRAGLFCAGARHP